MFSDCKGRFDHTLWYVYERRPVVISFIARVAYLCMVVTEYHDFFHGGRRGVLYVVERLFLQLNGESSGRVKKGKVWKNHFVGGGDNYICCLP